MTKATSSQKLTLIFSFFASIVFLLSKSYLSYDNSQQYFQILTTGDYWISGPRPARLLFQAPLLFLGDFENIFSWYNPYLYGVVYCFLPFLLISICYSLSKPLGLHFWNFSVFSLYLIPLTSYYHLLGRPTVMLFVFPLYGLFVSTLKGHSKYWHPFLLLILMLLCVFSHQLAWIVFGLVGILLIATPGLSSQLKSLAVSGLALASIYGLLLTLSFYSAKTQDVHSGLTFALHLFNSFSPNIGNTAIWFWWMLFITTLFMISPPHTKGTKIFGFGIGLSVALLLLLSLRGQSRLIFDLSINFRHIMPLTFIPLIFIFAWQLRRPTSSTSIWFSCLPLIMAIFLGGAGFIRHKQLTSILSFVETQEKSCIEMGSIPFDTGLVRHWSVNFDIMIYSRQKAPKKCLMHSCHGLHPRDMDRHLKNVHLNTNICKNP